VHSRWVLLTNWREFISTDAELSPGGAGRVNRRKTPQPLGFHVVLLISEYVIFFLALQIFLRNTVPVDARKYQSIG